MSYPNRWWGKSSLMHTNVKLVDCFGWSGSARITRVCPVYLVYELPWVSITSYDRTNGGSVGDFLRIALSSYHPTLFLSGNRTRPTTEKATGWNKWYGNKWGIGKSKPVKSPLIHLWNFVGLLITIFLHWSHCFSETICCRSKSILITRHPSMIIDKKTW